MADVEVGIKLVVRDGNVNRVLKGESRELDKFTEKRKQVARQGADFEERIARELIRTIKALRERGERDFVEGEQRKRREVRATSREQERGARAVARTSRQARQAGGGRGGGGMGARQSLGFLRGAVAPFLGPLAGAIGAREVVEAAGAESSGIGGALRQVGGIQSFQEAQSSAFQARRTIRRAAGESAGFASEEFEPLAARAESELSRVSDTYGIQVEALADSLARQQQLFGNFELALASVTASAEAASGTDEDFESLQTVVSQVSKAFNLSAEEIALVPGLLRQSGREGSVSPEVFFQNFARLIPNFKAGFGEQGAGFQGLQNMLGLAQLSVGQGGEASAAQSSTKLDALLRSLSDPATLTRMAQRGIQIREFGSEEEEATFNRLGRQGVGRVKAQDRALATSGALFDIERVLDILENAGLGNAVTASGVIGSSEAASGLQVLLAERNRTGQMNLAGLRGAGLAEAGQADLRAANAAQQNDPIFLAKQIAAQNVTSQLRRDSGGRVSEQLEAQGALSALQQTSPFIASIFSKVTLGEEDLGALGAVRLRRGMQRGKSGEFGQAGAFATGALEAMPGSSVITAALRTFFSGEAEQNKLGVSARTQLDDSTPIRVQVTNEVTINGEDPRREQGTE